MTAGNSQKEASPFINITPLIDILLVLLIIFMVISPAKPTDFKTKVPSGASLDKPHPDSLVVSIDLERRLKLNDRSNFGSVENPEPLAAELAQIFQKRKENRVYKQKWEQIKNLPEDERIEKTVFVKAPRSVNYGEVVRVIDSLKGAGAEPIGLQIDDLTQ